MVVGFYKLLLKYVIKCTPILSAVKKWKKALKLLLDTSRGNFCINYIPLYESHNQGWIKIL